MGMIGVATQGAFIPVGSYGRIAAVNVTDATETQLYNVPANTQVDGVVYVCNRNSTSTTYSVAVTDGAGAAAAEDWIVSGESLPANFHFPIDVSLNTENYIRVKGAASCDITFMLMGRLIT